MHPFRFSAAATLALASLLAGAGCGGSVETSSSQGGPGPGQPASPSDTTPSAPSHSPPPSSPDAYRVHGIAADYANVYFVDAGAGLSDSGRLLTRPASGGATTVLFGGDPGYRLEAAIALDDDFVYFAEQILSGAGANHRVRRVPKGGGAAELLGTTLEVRALAVDGSDLFLSVFDGSGLDEIRKMPKAGGAITTLATGQLWAGTLALTATDVLWARTGNDAATPGLFRTSKSGGAPVTAILETPNTGSIATDGRYVYFVAPIGTTTDCTLDGDVERIDLAGGAPETLAHAEPGALDVAIAYDPASFTATPAALVFTNEGKWCNGPTGPVGQVRSVTLDTGAVRTLADHLYLGWPGVAVSGTTSAFFARATSAEDDTAAIDALSLH